MNAWVDIVKTKAMHFGLHAMIWASWAWELTRDWSVKTWQGALEAHQPLTWVFFKRNQHPWPLRGTLPAHFTPVGSYCPEAVIFSFDSSTARHHDLENVISATLVCPNSIREDASWYFLALKWCGDSAPSVWEMVMAYFLSEGMIEQVQTIHKCKLIVDLADGTSVRISLNRKKNPKVVDPFTSWSVLAPTEAPVPAATIAPVPAPTPAPTPAPAPVVADAPVAANEQALQDNLASTSWVELQRDVGEGPRLSAERTSREDLEEVARRGAELIMKATAAETPA